MANFPEYDEQTLAGGEDKWYLIGHVVVDTASVLIHDPYWGRIRIGEKAYASVSDCLASELNHGVIVRSGGGDGGYPVVARMGFIPGSGFSVKEVRVFFTQDELVSKIEDSLPRWEDPKKVYSSTLPF